MVSILERREKNPYSSGIPCVITLFTLVQQDLGKPPYPRGDGYALCLIMKSWIAASISFVVMPTFELISAAVHQHAK